MSLARLLASALLVGTGLPAYAQEPSSDESLEWLHA